MAVNRPNIKGICGKLVLPAVEKGIIPGKTSIVFKVFAKDWWTDRCQYVQARFASGRSLSKGYIDEMRKLLESYILPYFKDFKLEKINKRLIEN